MSKPSRKRALREETADTAVDEALPRVELTAAETARDYLVRVANALAESNDLEASVLVLRCVGKMDVLVRKRDKK